MSICKQLKATFGGEWVLASINRRPVWLQPYSGIYIAKVNGAWMRVGQKMRIRLTKGSLRD